MTTEAERLKQEFDAGFALAIAPPEPFDDYLALRLGDDGYVVSLTDVASLHADRTIVAPFTARPHLLGVAGFRGVLVPVFDLRTLLGYSATSAPRWLVVAKSPKPTAFAFDAFDSFMRSPRSQAPAESAATSARRHVRGVISSRPLIALSSVLDALEQEIHP